jgi:chromate reductase, NAD(P)H dehydrogenase (quinone)
MAPIRILGISGSLRRGSHNTSLLRTAAASLPSGVELELYNGLADIPHYNEDLDHEPVPPAAARLRGAIAGADGVLIATPEYNGSLPGVLKNAIDWASRPFPDNAVKGKPVAVIGASTGLFGAVWAQAEARKALKIAGADVLEDEVPVGQAHAAFTDEGRLVEPEVQAALDELIGVLAARAGASEGGGASHGTPAATVPTAA